MVDQPCRMSGKKNKDSFHEGKSDTGRVRTYALIEEQISTLVRVYRFNHSATVSSS